MTRDASCVPRSVVTRTTRPRDGDAGDGLVEPDPVAQACGQVLGDLLHPAVDAGVLGAALGADQVLQPAAGMAVEQRVEEGQVRRLGREHRLAADPEELPAVLRAAVAQDPRLERLAVEHVRRSVSPMGWSRSTLVASFSNRCKAMPTSITVSDRAWAWTRCTAEPATEADESSPAAALVDRGASPNRFSSASNACWAGPTHWPPESTRRPGTPGTSTVRVRPPTRSLASSTMTSRPEATRRSAAVRPATPAPTTIAS